MDTTAIAIMDFVDEHLYRARRMRTAYTRVVDEGENGAYQLEDYKKKNLRACGPDPNQLLPRLAFALQATEPSCQLLRQPADFVTLQVRDLLWDPSDGHDGDTRSFKLEKVRRHILEAFADAHVFGCFRPHRYIDDPRSYFLDEPGAARAGVFVFEAHFLVWECAQKDLRRRMNDLADKHEHINDRPIGRWRSVAAGLVARTFLELLSVPRKQYTIDWIEGPDEFVARAIDLGSCAEIELKEVLKNRPFSSLIFACGDGQRIVDGALNYDCLTTKKKVVYFTDLR